MRSSFYRESLAWSCQRRSPLMPKRARRSSTKFGNGLKPPKETAFWIWSAQLASPWDLFIQRAAAISRRHVCFQKIGDTLVGVDLIFHSRKAVAFVFVDLVFDYP